MSFYLDSSVVVSALSQEPRSNDVLSWMRAQATGDLFISDWLLTEVSAALAAKVRAAVFSSGDHRAALASLSAMQSHLFRPLDLVPSIFAAATRFAGDVAAGLRAGDALHLAISAHHNEVLCTLDARQAGAGPHLGVRTLLL